jgi:hypothetical protein
MTASYRAGGNPAGRKGRGLPSRRRHEGGMQAHGFGRRAAAHPKTGT